MNIIKSFLTPRPSLLRFLSPLAALFCLLAAPLAHAGGGVTTSPVVVQFPATAVGATATAITETFTITGTATYATALHYSKDYFLGGLSCAVSGGTTTCTVSVYFRPTLPGVRKEAIFLTSGTTRVATVLLSGVGQAPLAVLQPGNLSTPATFASLGTGSYDSTPVTDENGVVYFVFNGNLYSGTTSANPTLLVSGIGPIYNLSIDGAGVLYWGIPPTIPVAASTINTYDTVQHVQGIYTMPASDEYFVTSVDGMGDVFGVGSNTNTIYKTTAAGVTTSAVVNPAVSNYSRAATDSAGDFFLSGGTINEWTAAGVQSQISTLNPGGAIAIDASNTIYTADNPPGELAPSNYNTAAFGFSALAGSTISGLTVQSNGMIYVGGLGGMRIIDRTQNTIAFGSQSEGITSATQTVNMLNIGNTLLIISNVALTGAGYTLQTAASNPCGSAITLAAGASCNIALTFESPNAGNYPGSIVITSNSLNNTASTQTITLSAFINGAYLTAVPSSLNFYTQTMGTTSAAQTIAVTNNGFGGPANITVGPSSSSPNFAVTLGTCGTSIAVGATCNLNVTFSPTASQSYSSTVTMTGNEGSGTLNSNISVAAIGTGIPVLTQTGGSGTNNVLIFNPAAVGIAPASAQTLTATYTITGYTSAVTPVATMHTGTSYTVGAPACTGPVTALVCTVAVKFIPIYPGNRKDAVFLTVNGTRVATTLVDGIGQSPFALIQPGVVTMPVVSNPNYFYTSVVDENGIAYIEGSNSNTIYTLSTAGVLTTLPITGLNSPRGLGLDGAGVLYIADQSSNGFFKTYDTVQGIQGTVSITSATTNTLQTLTTGNTGNVYSTDDIKVYTTLPNGTTTGVAINPAITQPSEMAVDSNEDVFLSGYSTNEILANNAGQSVVNTMNAGSGIGIDAAGTLYLSRYAAFSAGSVGLLPATNYSTAIAELDPTASPLGNSVGSDGTAYVSNYTNLDKVDRSQGKFTFNALNLTQTAAPQTAQIYNGGNMPLTLTSLTLTGDPDFTLTANGCTTGLVIQPGALCSVTVNFTAPGHGGVFNGNIAVITNSLNTTTTANIALIDTVAYPYFTISPTALTFGGQNLNTTSAPQTITITNNGAAVGNVGNGGFVGTGFTQILSGSCSSVPVNGSCTSSVTFTPTTATAYSATGTIAASSTPYPTFTATGTGTAPIATVSAASLPFGSQGNGTTSAPMTYTLTNTGTATLTIASITLQIATANTYEETNNCPASLVVQAFCTISVTFSPTFIGPANGNVDITDNSNFVNFSQQVTSLSGTGTAPLLSVVPTTLSYAATIGTTSPPQSVLVTNVSSAAISNLAISLTGTNSANFTQTATTCTANLAPSGSCTATITFTPPGTAGPYTATFSANSGTNTVSTTLTGTGNPFIANPQLQFSADILNAFAGTGAACNGSSTSTGDGGPATSAGICTAFATATDPSGNVYIVDQQLNTVRKITPAGIISTFAGKASLAGTYSGDGGQAALAGLNVPIDVISDAAGNIYIEDYSNSRIRKVNAATGIITTIYGGSLGFFNGTTNPIPVGGGMTFDPAGNFYLAGGFSHTVIKITPSGTASLFAGMMSNSGPGIAGYTGDGGLAYNATLNDPNAVASDLAGNIYIADTNNNVVRVVSAATGIISTYAGNGTLGYTGDGGPATSAELAVNYLSSDLAGDLYVIGKPGSSGNTTIIREISPGGADISTVAGNGTGTVGGPAYSAALTASVNARIDLNGDLIIPANTQVFKVGPNGIVPFGNQSTGTTSAAQTVTFQNTGNTALTLTSPTYTASGPFNVTGGTCQGLVTLASGATCTLTVTFSPTTATVLTGTISVPTSDAVTPQTITLTGTGVAVAAAQAVLAPALTFAATPVSSTTTAQTVTLSNAGTAALTITSATASSEFIISANTCGSSLAAGSSCTYSITFTPNAAGPQTGTLTVVDAVGTQSVGLTGTGTAPQAVLTPPSLTFSSTTVGASAAAQVITLSNPGNATLSITSANIPNSEFPLTTTCSATLAGLTSCTYSVTFTPNASGTQTSTFTLIDSAGTQTVGLSGIGAAAATPQAVLTPSLSFGPIAVGTSAPTQTLTLSNPGAAALTITSIAATGAGFSQTNNCGTSVAASGSCTITVSFTPGSAAALTGAITVTDNALPTTQSAALTGTGTAPQAALTPTLTFPSTVLNVTATAMVATLTNAGNVALPITSATLSSTTEFAVSANTCGNSLAAASSCAYSITFTPNATGSQTATLTVVDSVGTQMVALTGTGAPIPVATAVLSPTSFTFASTYMGTPSAPQVITLTNGGTASLTGITISFTGTNPTAYSETTTCTAALAAGSTCNISVIFTPTAANTYTANLSVADSLGTQTVALTGTGNSSTGFTVVAPNPTQSVDPGGVATYNINVNTLTGNFTLPVTLTASGLPTGATYSFSPATVIPGTTGAPSVLTIQTSPQFALRSPAANPALRMPVFAVLALLPLAGLRRIRRKLRALSPGLRLLTLLLLSLAAILPLSGCGGGYFGRGPEAFVITVTGTSTASTQSTTVTLNLQ